MKRLNTGQIFYVVSLIVQGLSNFSELQNYLADNKISDSEIIDACKKISSDGVVSLDEKAYLLALLALSVVKR